MSLITFTLLSIFGTFVIALGWFAVASTNIKTTALLLASAGAGSLYGTVYDEAIAKDVGALFGLAGAFMAKFLVALLAGRLLRTMKKKRSLARTRVIR